MSGHTGVGGRKRVAKEIGLALMAVFVGGIFIAVGFWGHEPDASGLKDRREPSKELYTYDVGKAKKFSSDENAGAIVTVKKMNVGDRTIDLDVELFVPESFYLNLTKDGRRLVKREREDSTKLVLDEEFKDQKLLFHFYDVYSGQTFTQEVKLADLLKDWKSQLSLDQGAYSFSVSVPVWGLPQRYPYDSYWGDYTIALEVPLDLHLDYQSPVQLFIPLKSEFKLGASMEGMVVAMGPGEYKSHKIRLSRNLLSICKALGIGALPWFAFIMFMIILIRGRLSDQDAIMVLISVLTVAMSFASLRSSVVPQDISHITGADMLLASGTIVNMYVVLRLAMIIVNTRPDSAKNPEG
jgi:hypothetical protein